MEMVFGCMLLLLLVTLYFVNDKYPTKQADVWCAFAGALMALTLACACKCSLKHTDCGRF